jgi:hypothetical protein
MNLKRMENVWECSNPDNIDLIPKQGLVKTVFARIKLINDLSIEYDNL